VSISSKTFESKKQPGLFFIGEVIDVTGWLGGYNFQFCWASGFAGHLVLLVGKRFNLPQPTCGKSSS